MNEPGRPFYAWTVSVKGVSPDSTGYWASIFEKAARARRFADIALAGQTEHPLDDMTVVSVRLTDERSKYLAQKRANKKRMPCNYRVWTRKLGGPWIRVKAQAWPGTTP
jgi:hypothetical protein